MRDFFRFLSDFIDSIFYGWRGKIGLISLGMALSFLGMWVAAEVLQSRSDVGPPLRGRFFLVIATSTLLAWYAVLTNRNAKKQSQTNTDN
jgi:hypothetical protein